MAYTTASFVFLQIFCYYSLPPHNRNDLPNLNYSHQWNIKTSPQWWSSIHLSQNSSFRIRSNVGNRTTGTNGQNGSKFDTHSLLMVTSRTSQDSQKIQSLKDKFRSRCKEITEAESQPTANDSVIVLVKVVIATATSDNTTPLICLTQIDWKEEGLSIPIVAMVRRVYFPISLLLLCQ